MKVSMKKTKLFLLNPKLNDRFIVRIKFEFTYVAKYGNKL